MARLLAAAGALTLTLGGCSMSGQFDSLFGDTKSERTGSITPPPGSKDAAQMPPDADLAYARAAASAVLSRGEKDSSMPWENPRTGARGTVTPIASAYTHGRPDLPRFPGELRHRQLAVLAAGRGLQARAGRVGSAHAQALEAVVVLFHVPPHSFPLIRESAGAQLVRGMSGVLEPRCIDGVSTPH